MAARGKLKDGASASGYYQCRCCSATCRRTAAWRRRKCSARCWPPWPSTPKEAVALANGTLYGLVAGVWTRDGARQLRLARQLRAGQVFVNNYGAGGGVELPFGGSRQSGYGREKGFEALYGFTTLKTIAINDALAWFCSKAEAARGCAASVLFWETCADSSSACTRPVFSGEGALFVVTGCGHGCGPTQAVWRGRECSTVLRKTAGQGRGSCGRTACAEPFLWDLTAP